MAENLYNSNHKATNDKFRKEYDRIFRKTIKYINTVVRDEMLDRMWEKVNDRPK